MKIIAHRSGPTNYPEQTVESAVCALGLGADMVEIDLRLTSDGKIAVSHDNRLGRLYGTDISINDITLADYCSMERKDNGKYHGQSFEDYIKSGIKPLLLHIKEGGENIPVIIDFLKGVNYLENVIFGVCCPDDVRLVKESAPSVPVLAFMQKEEMLESCVAAGAEYIRLWQGWVTEEKIKKIQASGCEAWIMVGGCNGFDVGETNKEFLKEIIKYDADAVLINDISEIINFKQ